MEKKTKGCNYQSCTFLKCFCSQMPFLPKVFYSIWLKGYFFLDHLKCWLIVTPSSGRKWEGGSSLKTCLNTPWLQFGDHAGYQIMKKISSSDLCYWALYGRLPFALCYRLLNLWKIWYTVHWVILKSKRRIRQDTVIDLGNSNESLVIMESSQNKSYRNSVQSICNDRSMHRRICCCILEISLAWCQKICI